MRVLVACEFSGTVRDAFIKRGHHAVSCDLLEQEGTGHHYVGDVADIIGEGWDMMIAFPPCTYLSSSGLHWNKRVAGRQAKTDSAIRFVRSLLDAPIERIALENPVGCISTKIRKPTQIIQPYDFGEDASKRTCLWLNGLMPLRTTRRISGRIVNGVERWSNQTDSGQNRLGPSEDRWRKRAITYQGIADAFAAQWGNNDTH